MLIAFCMRCKAASNSKIFEPLTLTTMPPKPWRVLIHENICGPFPSGDYRLGLIETIRSVAAPVAIEKLKKMLIDIQ